MLAASTFSGVGGLDLGLARAGIKHAFFAESDPWRRSILAHHWPGVPVYDDVREVAVTGIGKTPWNKGRSYTIAKREVYANKGAWSAAMRRMYPSSCMRCGWGDAPCDTHHISPKRDGGEMSLENGITLCPNCHRLADNGRITVDELYRIRAAAPLIGERIGVMPSEAPQIDLVCGGFPQRAKTSALLESAPALQASEADSSSSSPESLTLFDPPGCSQRMFPGSRAVTMVGTSASSWERWPNSGTASPGGCSTHATSESPKDAVASSLSDILEATPHPRYALSAKAAAGILRRASARGRDLPSALQTALERLANS